jgi:NIPSNAP
MHALKILLLAGLAVASLDARAETTYLCEGDGSRIHQLRIYELNPANRDNFHRRFQDHAIRIMKRHDFEIVDMWESQTDSKLQFVYVLSWPDEATMKSRWEEFLADPEWVEIKRRSAAEHGELVREANGQPLARVSYSPACKG